MVIAIAACRLAVSSSWVDGGPSACWFLEMLRVVSFTGEHIFEAGSETLGVDSLDMWRLDVGWVIGLIGHWKVTLEPDSQVFSYFCKLLSSVYWIECFMLAQNALFTYTWLTSFAIAGVLTYWQQRVWHRLWRSKCERRGGVCIGWQPPSISTLSSDSKSVTSGGSESWGLLWNN